MKTEWIQGKRAVQEVLRSQRQIKEVYLAEGIQKGSVRQLLEQMDEQRVSYTWVPRKQLDQWSNGGKHQGIMAQVAPYQYASLEDCFVCAEERQESPFFLLLDQIEDPHNLGSIIRTADAAGVHGVIIPKKRAVGLTSAVAKSSVGAIEYVPVVQVTNTNRTLEELKKKGMWIVGTDINSKQNYTELDYTIPITLVIGNENKGISRLTKKKCDYMVQIPMRGQVASLNASVAAGIMIYEVIRHRKVTD